MPIDELKVQFDSMVARLGHAQIFLDDVAETARQMAELLIPKSSLWTLYARSFVFWLLRLWDILHETVTVYAQSHQPASASYPVLDAMMELSSNKRFQIFRTLLLREKAVTSMLGRLVNLDVVPLPSQRLSTEALTDLWMRKTAEEGGPNSEWTLASKAEGLK
jgi:hypothetical protein